MGINQRHCAADGEQWQQRQQQRSGTTIPLARQGCVTGVIVIIIKVSVTASAYAAAAVPGHVVAVTVVVAGAATPAANIVILPMIGKTTMRAAGVGAPVPPPHEPRP